MRSRASGRYSIHVHTPGAYHWILFDAKYRLDAQSWLAELTSDVLDSADDGGDDQEEDRDVFKKADLYKMHTYRDAVVGTRGAYLLFPGDTVGGSLFIRHKQPAYRAAFSIPSVGAFPLRPGRTDAQEATLQGFLYQILKAIAAAGGTYVEEHWVG